ncbi:MAG TPA: diguanylate cyclase [Gemmatimonadaceae bacterium]
MPSTFIALVLTSSERPLIPSVDAWLGEAGLSSSVVKSVDELLSRCLRGRPRVVLVDARSNMSQAEEACGRIKADSYSAVVPTIVVCEPGNGDMERCFTAGADEVVTELTPGAEARSRLRAALSRSDRDIHVHPSTRLPGTDIIETCITRQLAKNEQFAVAYADLDHFKEFNDRYGYHEGDRVIRVLARILHDVVKGLCGEGGFVGHIGGDDFIFIIPAGAVQSVCAEIIGVFDLLVPFQYSESDRRAGYFFGKDRRGQLHRVPLMTLSIGVVTNERRPFTSPAQVSELATEMKAYAKSLPGSVFSVDRRTEAFTPVQPRAGLQTPPSLRFQ